MPKILADLFYMKSMSSAEKNWFRVVSLSWTSLWAVPNILWRSTSMMKLIPNCTPLTKSTRLVRSVLRRTLAVNTSYCLIHACMLSVRLAWWHTAKTKLLMDRLRAFVVLLPMEKRSANQISGKKTYHIWTCQMSYLTSTPYIVFQKLLIKWMILDGVPSAKGQPNLNSKSQEDIALSVSLYSAQPAKRSTTCSRGVPLSSTLSKLISTNKIINIWKT